MIVRGVNFWGSLKLFNVMADHSRRGLLKVIAKRRRILNYLQKIDDKRYKGLELCGENPVDPGITGEIKNPFAPF